MDTHQKTNIYNKFPSGLSFFLGLGTFLILAWLLVNLKIIFLPMILAFFICSILNPLVNQFQKWGLPRALAVVVTLILGLAVIWIVVNFILSSLTAFRDGYPVYRQRLEDIISQLSAFRDKRFSFITLDLIKSNLSGLSISKFFSSFFNSIFSFTGYLLLTIIFLLYFLPSLPALPPKLRKSFPGDRGVQLCLAIESISNQVQRYILAKSLLSTGLGIMVGIICWLFGVDFSTTWGIFTFFLNFIPTIGAVAASLLPMIVCALQYSWTTALWLGLALGALMIISGNFLEPLILGRSVNLSPVIALLAILAWGILWGGIGMIIAVPATAVLKFTCDNFTSLKPVGAMMGN